MKRLFMGLVLAVASSAFAEAPQPYIWWKMDRVVDGKVPNDGTNTDARCDLTLGPAVTMKTVYGVGNALYFDAATAVSKDAWATSWTPALKSRTVAFWICRDADNSKFDPAVNKIHYVFSGLSRENVMLAPNTTAMNVKLGAKETTSEDIAHSYFYTAANFTRDAWHQIVIVLEDTGATCTEEGAYFGNPIYDLHVYQDGVLYKTVEGRVTESGLDDARSFTVGNSAVNQTRTLPGALSDVRIYDCALTADDVTALWNADLLTHGPRVLGFWRMEKIDTDEKGVRTVADATGLGVPLTVGEKNEIMENAGVSGNALDFTDWAQNYGVAKNKSALIRDFTVSLWMRPQTGMDKLESEGNVGNKAPHLFQFAGYYRCAFGNLGDAYNNLNMFDMASVTNSLVSGQYVSNVFMAKGYWSHFAFVAKAEQDAEGKWSVTPKYYCNGELVFTGRTSTCPDFEAKGVYPDGKNDFLLGNSAYPNQARAMWGQMDDVAFFGSALTDEDVRRLYRGVPEVDAGKDFTVVGETARLAGSLSLSHGGVCDRAACQDSAVWSLASAPEGATATIAAADDLATVVTLPVEGTYVFRLTASLVGLSVHDEVTVTRVAAAGGAAPTLAVTVPATAVATAPIALSASAGGGTGPVRVFWSKVSGPGAVGFEPKEGEQTFATFYEAGEYVVRATADDGERTASQDATVTVSVSEAVSLTSGLIGYWPLGSSKRDEITKTEFDATHYNASAVVCPGVDGYGTRVKTINDKTLFSGVTLQETPLYPGETTDSRNTIPKERWRALSLWIKYDPQSDTNGACMSVLAEARYTLGLFYDRTNGTDRIAMYQQTMCNAIKGRTNIDYYTADVPSFDDRWVHVYAVFDRQTGYSSNASELWIDGVKQVVSDKGMGGGRIQDGNPLQFGNINAATGTAGANDRWGNMPRTFPGSLDEIRLYNRKLTEAEIRFLAANPVVDVNHAPAADVVAVPADAVRGESAAVAATAADDGLPVGSTLTGSWVVLSGNAENLVFTDPTARETQAKALKAGSYTVAYRACDGEKTTYSDPQTYVVGKSGTILFLR